MQAKIDKVASECVAVRLRMLNRVITNIYDDALRSLDLKVSQMNILVAAAKLGTARPAAVCAHLHLDVSTLSRNVERMKGRGWLERLESGLYAITADGVDKIASEDLSLPANRLLTSRLQAESSHETETIQLTRTA